MPELISCLTSSYQIRFVSALVNGSSHWAAPMEIKVKNMAKYVISDFRELHEILRRENGD